MLPHGEVLEKVVEDEEEEETEPKDSDVDIQAPSATDVTQNAHLSKIRQENLAKKRSLTKQMKMPELAETSELDSTKTALQVDGAAATINHVDIFDEDNVSARAFPNLPDETLERLGLLRKKGDALDNGDHLATEQDIEEKYASLSLAFKTDKLTLEQRIDLHERARDKAEQNIDQELENLKKAMKAMSPFCTDAQSRDVFTKIQHHVEILEQSTSRVSSRAEIHGAVQQELRLSKAVEVMMQHVENLKHLYEKEHAELEETRKILQENKMQTQDGDGTGLKRYSLAGVSSTKKAALLVPPITYELGGKRRASVAVFQRRSSMLGAPNSSSLESLDPKSRFQNVIADTTVKSSVANAFRRPSSTDKKSSLDSATSNDTTPPATPPAVTISGDATKQETNNNTPTAKSHSPPGSPHTSLPDGTSLVKEIDEDIAYQRGFEEGIRAQVSHHLAELNEQQRGLSDALESLMEQNEMEEVDPTPQDGLLRRFRDMLPCWEVAGKHLRFTVAGVVFFMALLSLLITLLPHGNAQCQRARHAVDWSSIEALLDPYMTVRRNDGSAPF